jgi:hypothetical protein
VAKKLKIAAGSRAVAVRSPWLNLTTRHGTQSQESRRRHVIETGKFIRARGDGSVAFDQAFGGRHPSLLKQQEPIATLTQGVDHCISISFALALAS